MFAKLRKKIVTAYSLLKKCARGVCPGLSAHPAVTDGEVFCISSLKIYVFRLNICAFSLEMYISSLKMQDLTRCGGGSIAGKPSECACACRNVRTGNGERNEENSPVECHSSSPEDAGICHFRPKSVHNSSERIKCCTESYAVTCVGVFSFIFL